MSLFDFFNFFSLVHNKKKQADAALYGRGERPKNGADARPCLSDVYKDGTRAKRRQADVPLYAISSLFSFLRRGLQMRRNFSTTCTTLGTRGEKLQADAALCGRSMVEMLGVLAIIGVLSVGAMSGYSKAMFKYKLNKQTEQINQIMMAMIEYKSVFSSTAHNESLVPLFVKLNALPPEMINENDTKLSDVFGLGVNIRRLNNPDNMYFIYSLTGKSDDNHEICRNILESFKGYAAELVSVGINSTTSEVINQQDWWYGEQAPKGSSQRMYLLNLEKMQTLCQKCDSNNCGIYAVFPI